MTDEVSDATRLVRQTSERFIKEYHRATDRQLLKLLKLAARANDELKDAAFEWINWIVARLKNLVETTNPEPLPVRSEGIKRDRAHALPVVGWRVAAVSIERVCRKTAAAPS